MPDEKKAPPRQIQHTILCHPYLGLGRRCIGLRLQGSLKTIRLYNLRIAFEFD